MRALSVYQIIEQLMKVEGFMQIIRSLMSTTIGFSRRIIYPFSS